MRWGDWYWPLWMVVVSVSLLGPEIYALSSDSRNTLSDWVWVKLQVTTTQQLPWTAAHFLVFGGWLTLTVWLTWHFFFRRFT